MVQRSPESLSEVFMILKNKNLMRHLFSVVDTGGFLSACVVRKWKYKSAVTQMEALEVQLLSTAVDPHLSSPSVTWSLIVFSWQRCFDHRCVEHWGVLILRHWCMVSFFPSGPLCWEKCSSNTGLDGTGVSREWLQHPLLPHPNVRLNQIFFLVHHQPYKPVLLPECTTWYELKPFS